jgi:hypothetical protein
MVQSPQHEGKRGILDEEDGRMQPGPRPRTRRRKAPITIVDAAAPETSGEGPALSTTEPELASISINNSELYFEDAPQPPIFDSTGVVIEDTPQPTVIDSTGVALEEFTPAQEPAPAGERTDFYFPPLPPTDRLMGHEATGGGAQSRARRERQKQHTGQAGKAILTALLAVLRVLWRALRCLGQGNAKAYQRLLRPGFRKVWHWIVDDPYAPPRASGEQSLLQGRVLGMYQYHRYQRVILFVLGVVPALIAIFYALDQIISEFRFGFDSRLFLVQDLAGSAAGFFGCLIFIRLATTRITLRSDGIEYKTMFRQIRSRWEEIGVLKVEYFRGSERWVVGSGRGAWAFLYVDAPQAKGKFAVVRVIHGAWGWLTRSPLGLPKGRQLAKLITIYARLGSTGTPYWLPMVGRFTEHDPFRRAPVTMNESEPEEAASTAPS